MKKSLQLLFAMSMFVLLIGTACAEVITTSIPPSASPSSSFTISYTASGVSGKWGSIIVHNIAGGCKFPDGTTEYKNVMLSSGGTTNSITITSPASGSCTFTGYYQFSDQSSSTNFPNSVTTISGGGSCTPDCSCSSSTCTGNTCSNGCGGTCSGTKTCSGSCTPDWQCGSWSTCSNSQQSRTCTDSNSCGLTNPNPLIQSCTNTTPTTPSSFDFNMVVFTIGGFNITLWMLLVGGVVLVIIIK